MIKHFTLVLVALLSAQSAHAGRHTLRFCNNTGLGLTVVVNKTDNKNATKTLSVKKNSQVCYGVNSTNLNKVTFTFKTSSNIIASNLAAIKDGKYTFCCQSQDQHKQLSVVVTTK